ncbi:MAG: hypothetical protein II920_05280 [Clostridia bacterium]|nr:hypothetical protein [Clostridia bacterium]
MKSYRVGRVARVVAAALCAVLVAGLFVVRGWRHHIKHIVCTDDYPTLYAEELEEMLGDYTVGERSEKHFEGVDCSCGFHEDALDYYEWELSYTDINGMPMSVKLNNHLSLYQQQLDWARDQIKAHYEAMVVGRFGDAGYMPVYCWFGDIVHSAGGGGDLDEQMRHMDTASAYKKALAESKEPLLLHDMDYATVFWYYPVLLDVNISLSDADMDEAGRAVYRNEALAAFDELILCILEDSGGRVNMSASLNSNADQSRLIQVYYVDGELTDFSGNTLFDHAVFEAYAGNTW